MDGVNERFAMFGSGAVKNRRNCLRFQISFKHSLARHI